jgi:hypothetical protein
MGDPLWQAEVRDHHHHHGGDFIRSLPVSMPYHSCSSSFAVSFLWCYMKGSSRDLEIDSERPCNYTFRDEQILWATYGYFCSMLHLVCVVHLGLILWDWILYNRQLSLTGHQVSADVIKVSCVDFYVFKPSKNYLHLYLLYLWPKKQENKNYVFLLHRFTKFELAHYNVHSASIYVT